MTARDVGQDAMVNRCGGRIIGECVTKGRKGREVTKESKKAGLGTRV